MKSIELYTIGFTKKSAETFFEKLKNAGVKRIIDIRLNNTSQISGFAKKDNLIYFLKEIANIDYVHLPELAPSQELFNFLKKQHGAWAEYEERYLKLIEERKIESIVPLNIIKDGCLLCSEDKPHFCHRRLVAEYLKDKLDQKIEIKHLF